MKNQPEAEQPGATVRRLMAEARQATLATALARDGSGRPYASLVLVAPAADGSPILLLSDLAEHSRNLERDARAALLFDGTAGLDDPLTGPRVSILGQVRPVTDRAEVAGLKAIFQSRHPGAAAYADFTDFRVYRMAVESAHFVAGFGQIHWLSAAEIAAATKLGQTA